MNMPNFLIIGAAKSGTTALYEYLKQHPQIYLSPVKEPEFFSFEGEQLNYGGPGVTINASSITNLEAYQRLFQQASEQQMARGEASALSLYIPKAAGRIKHYVPNAKLIAILRNPVDRAYASFTHLIRDGREPITDFAQALAAEKQRIEQNWGFLWRYQDLGFYFRQLKPYFDTFDPAQIKVYLYDDFCSNPWEIMLDIFEFLEVDKSFIPDMSDKPNISGIPRNQALQVFLNQPNPIKTALKPLIPTKFYQKAINKIMKYNLSKPSLEPKIREQLILVFKQDILQLQSLISRDLSNWLI
jgi:hypothetical protein